MNNSDDLARRIDIMQSPEDADCGLSPAPMLRALKWWLVVGVVLWIVLAIAAQS